MSNIKSRWRWSWEHAQWMGGMFIERTKTWVFVWWDEPEILVGAHWQVRIDDG
jgi:hypothetical protein